MDHSKDYTQEARATVVGSSDAPIILGVSSFMSPMDLWLQKTGATEPPEQTIAMSVGKELEDLVARLYLEQSGNGFRLFEPDIMKHPKHPWMVAHLDRLVLAKNGDVKPIKGLECKTANVFMRHDWGKEGSDDIPEAYLVQVMHCMAVTGLPEFDVAVLIGSDKFQVYNVKADAELIDILIRKEREFMDCVEENVPPEIDGSKAYSSYLAEKYGPDSGEVVQISPDDETMGLINDFRAAHERFKRAEEEKDRLANEVRSRMGTAKKWSGHDFSINWGTVNPAPKLDLKGFSEDCRAVIQSFQPEWDFSKMEDKHMKATKPFRRFQATFK